MDDELTRLPVVLVNRSTSGRTIGLQEHITLPNPFRILFDRLIEPYILVWQDGRLAGVKLNNDQNFR